MGFDLPSQLIYFPLQNKSYSWHVKQEPKIHPKKPKTS